MSTGGSHLSLSDVSFWFSVLFNPISFYYEFAEGEHSVVSCQTWSCRTGSVCVLCPALSGCNVTHQTTCREKVAWFKREQQTSAVSHEPPGPHLNTQSGLDRFVIHHNSWIWFISLIYQSGNKLEIWTDPFLIHEQCFYLFMMCLLWSVSLCTVQNNHFRKHFSGLQ